MRFPSPNFVVAFIVVGLAAGNTWAEHPRDWGGGGKDYELTIDTEVKHGGKASGLIRSKVDTPEAFGTFTQPCQAEKFRGKRVRLSGWMKSEGIDGKAGLWMRVDGKEKTGLAFDNMFDRAIVGTSDWAQFHVVLGVADNAEQVFFGCLLSGKGKVWVDDLTLEPVGADIATTGLKIDSAPRGDRPLIEVPAEPKNLDFEP